MATYVLTGDGAGKTTSALGLALRSIGHKRRVVVVQFLKWWKKTGEYKVAKKLAPNYKIFQFGRKGWKGVKNLTTEDKKLAHQALIFAEKIVKEQKPDLLILDEINLATHYKLLRPKEVISKLEEIKKVKRDIDIVLTGRNAPRKFISFADFANRVSVIKMSKKLEAKRGIQY